MARYRVAHRCGHSSAQTLYGPSKERGRRLAWLAAQPCAACIRATELERAANAAERDDLPDLIGTEKQIAWALALRHKTLLLLDRFLAGVDLDQAAPMPESLAFAPGETVTPRALLDRLRRQDAARWWIDHARDVERAGKRRPNTLDGVSESTFAERLLRELAGFRPLTEGEKTIANARESIVPVHRKQEA